MPTVSVDQPLVELPGAVGHASLVLVDGTRADRRLAAEVWYPAAGAASEPAVYDLFAGVSFTASATEEATAVAGPLPVVVFSHGRTGTRTSYVMLCEALAAHGYAVVAADHPGDRLEDWFAGAAVDDATNEAQRVDDIAHVLDAVASGRFDGLAPTLELDHGRVIVIGHSYGGWTAVVSAIEHAPAIRGAVGLQPFTRSVSRDDLARAAVPVLLVAAGADATTPPALDSHPAFEVLGAPSVDLVVVAEAGHQACSDVGLYVELLPEVDGLPELVSDLVGGMAADVTGRAGDPWRPVVALHLELVVAWADAVLVGADTAAAVVPFAGRPGVDVRSRRR